MVNKLATTVALLAAAASADARDLLGRKGTTMEVVQPVTGYQAVQVMQPVQGYQTMRVRVRPGPVQVAQPVVAQPVAVQQVVQPQVVQVAEAAPATYTAAPGYVASAPLTFGKHKGRRLSGAGESEKKPKHWKGEADGESSKKMKKYLKGEADDESGKKHGKHLLGHKDGEAGEAIKAPKVHKIKGEADGESSKKAKKHLKGEADDESGKKHRTLLGKGEADDGESVKKVKKAKDHGESVKVKKVKDHGESVKTKKVKGEADGESAKKHSKGGKKHGEA